MVTELQGLTMWPCYPLGYINIGDGYWQGGGNDGLIMPDIDMMELD